MIRIVKRSAAVSVIAMSQESPVARIAPLRVRLRRRKPAHGMHNHHVGTRLALDARPSTIIVPLELPPSHQLQEIAPRPRNSFVVITERIAFRRMLPRRGENFNPKRPLA